MKYVVYFASILDLDDEVFVDYIYFGGVTYNKEDAEKLSRNITNDKRLSGAILPKIMVTNNFKESYDIANKYFNRLANDMYDIEKTRNSKRKK